MSHYRPHYFLRSNATGAVCAICGHEATVRVVWNCSGCAGDIKVAAGDDEGEHSHACSKLDHVLAVARKHSRRNKRKAK